jgi:V-type H+-transporting ATPase subunit a
VLLIGSLVVSRRYFRQPLNIICEFIPEMIFLSFIFVYLCLIIFVKWVKFTPAMSGDAPNLLIGFINMFLMNYSDAKAIWYPGQVRM